MTANSFGSSDWTYRLYSAGISLRPVRSPVAPKITIAWFSGVFSVTTSSPCGAAGGPPGRRPRGPEPASGLPGTASREICSHLGARPDIQEPVRPLPEGDDHGDPGQAGDAGGLELGGHPARPELRTAPGGGPEQVGGH